jgi:paraquat-inducible protein A
MNRPIPTELWLQCPRCHAECRDRQLAKNEYLRCARCGEEIKTPQVGRTIPVAWALSTTGLILMVLANTYPIMSFSIAGNSQTNLIYTGIAGLWFQGYGLLSALVFFCVMAAPALYLVTVWYACAAWCLHRRWRGLHSILNIAAILESWNLVPVFAVACVVAAVKLRTLGSVRWEVGVFWVILYALCILLTIQFFDRKKLILYVEEERL